MRIQKSHYDMLNIEFSEVRRVPSSNYVQDALNLEMTPNWYDSI